MCAIAACLRITIAHVYSHFSGNVGIAKDPGKLDQALVPNVKVLATTSLLNAPLARVQAALKDSLHRFVTFKQL